MTLCFCNKKPSSSDRISLPSDAHILTPWNLKELQFEVFVNDCYRVIFLTLDFKEESLDEQTDWSFLHDKQIYLLVEGAENVAKSIFLNSRSLVYTPKGSFVPSLVDYETNAVFRNWLTSWTYFAPKAVREKLPHNTICYQ
jgi:hypothetical protein